MKIPMNMNTDKIKNSTWMKKFKKFINSNKFTSVVATIIVSIIIWAAALIPIGVYVLTRFIIKPMGFWQELALIIVFGVGVGWLQVILVIAAVCMTVVLIDET